MWRGGRGDCVARPVESTIEARAAGSIQEASRPIASVVTQPWSLIRRSAYRSRGREPEHGHRACLAADQLPGPPDLCSTKIIQLFFYRWIDILYMAQAQCQIRARESVGAGSAIVLLISRLWAKPLASGNAYTY